MFFGHITQVNMQYYPVPIQKALKFLSETDFSQLACGRYEIEGERIYAQVLDLETQRQESILPEVHRRYLDVQFLYSGEEKIGVTIDRGQFEVAQEYDEKRDILFYKEVTDETMLVMRPGNFAVFFPSDVHRPACADSTSVKIKKIVVKIAVDLI